MSKLILNNQYQLKNDVFFIMKSKKGKLSKKVASAGDEIMLIDYDDFLGKFHIFFGGTVSEWYTEMWCDENLMPISNTDIKPKEQK